MASKPLIPNIISKVTVGEPTEEVVETPVGTIILSGLKVNSPPHCPLPNEFTPHPSGPRCEVIDKPLNVTSIASSPHWFDPHVSLPQPSSDCAYAKSPKEAVIAVGAVND